MKRGITAREAEALAEVYPRCLRLGLIEAMNDLKIKKSPFLVYPRCLRLGLIEATTWPRCWAYGSPCIRGVYASASLKRGIDPRKPHIYLGCIRGVYASASLKQESLVARLPAGKVYPRCLRLGLIEAAKRRGGNGASMSGIRGVYASASLKRGIQVELHERQELYPRCLRLGLIEA